MEEPALPITIHRSIIGLLVIVIRGLLVFGLLLALAYWLKAQNPADTLPLAILGLMSVVVILVTIVQVVVYDLATLTLREQGIAVSNWATLFVSKEAVADWDQIEDITVEQSGPIAGLLGIGTILVQTAGTQTNFRLTWVPRVKYWRDFIDQRS
ncbi:hypothetical protein QM806_04475 [Rhodococcus sp. IEGM 1351]|uniref:hypothetical protein n=1 Tax=Rhodococcus sp. IEGM 1351 TaxID=3047089 RepID=UPI0024B7563A|nr:hypothetical protein [Rhodococcus sp. IEGM 1351]MDI9934710.1 hypothetical protein [Rhodococcus sp. IEGM 1351]